MINLQFTYTRYVIHPIQATLALLAYSIFRILPFGLASEIGGCVGRLLGPYIPISQRAIKNLSRVFPDKSPAEIKHLVVGMWDNLGRLVGEYPQ